MQLSTKARYAVRAMVELTLKDNKEPVKLKDIADSQDISLKYLEQVMFPLRVRGYVKTLKGSQGGYLMSKPPEQITILEIVECVEGSMSPVECADNPDICKRKKICAAREVWVGLKDAISTELSKITLADLAKKQSLIYKKEQK